ncbi:uncharacterized protein [Nicotiana tomentosiformis]|uniref:uncharacterized protein n=1 Tax=Nicotiana tomentosiformis TaxID=4098 RepID=UPI00388C39D1
MVKDCPRLRRGAPPQTSQPPCSPTGPQAMITAPATATPSQLTRGGGQGGRGRPRGGGHARYYALPSRTKEVASDSVIIGIVPDSLSSLVYVSTPVGDSLVVDSVYRLGLISLSGFETIADLLFLSMVNFDIILGMEWLSRHYAILDCHAKTVTLAISGLP